MSKSNRAKLKDIKAGATLWYVHALGTSSFLTKLPIIKKPYISRHGSLFFQYVSYGEYSGAMNTSASVHDGNIIENNYNCHKIFLTENSAKKYLKQCIDYNIRLNHDDWDVPDYYEDY